MSKIKICGLSRECDRMVANELKPEYVGFVFWEKSRRNISKQTAAKLRALLDPSIRTVGVFVDAPYQFVAELLNENILDVAQLHGHETSDYIHSLRALSQKPVIQAFKVLSQADLEKAEQSEADYVLLDSGTGSGKQFDWSLLQKMQRPFFLAGGLSIDNVEEALQKFNPYAVDVSSGVETDGWKDEKKMREFVLAVRRKEE